MITQTGSKLLIELDENVQAEMAETMAAGLRALPDDGIFAFQWTEPRCLAGCRLHLDDGTERYCHAPDCPLPVALAVARLCSDVLANVKLISECLDMARQSAEILPAEEKIMTDEQAKNGEPTVAEFKSSPPICPHCEKLGKRNPLTPKGSKLECPACGNVLWAKDPSGANSRNEVPQ